MTGERCGVNLGPEREPITRDGLYEGPLRQHLKLKSADSSQERRGAGVKPSKAVENSALLLRWLCVTCRSLAGTL